MEVTLNDSDILNVKTKQGEIKIISNCGRIVLSGETIYKNMDDLEYNNILDSLKDKCSFWGKNEEDKEKEWQILRSNIDSIVKFASEYLSLDKSYVLQALVSFYASVYKKHRIERFI